MKPNVPDFIDTTTKSIQPKEEGKITIIADDRINHLIERHVALNDSLGEISGYRIQLFSISGVNSKIKAEEVKANFIRLYPEVPVKLIFISPNFKVQGGAFRTKLEALEFQNTIKVDFPDGYIIPDNIKSEEFQAKK